ncbi:hypothetical protein GEMRC1_011373 [Eukaryota sp. GEM-RC1]
MSTSLDELSADLCLNLSQGITPSNNVAVIISFGRYIRDSSHQLSLELPIPDSYDRVGFPLLPSETIDQKGHWIDDSLFDVQIGDRTTSAIFTFSPLLNELFYNHRLRPGTCVSVNGIQTLHHYVIISEVEVLGSLNGCPYPPIFPAHLTDVFPSPQLPISSLIEVQPKCSLRHFFLPLHDNTLPLPCFSPTITLSPIPLFTSSSPTPSSLTSFLNRGLSRFPFAACVLECGQLSHTASSSQVLPSFTSASFHYPFSFLFKLADSHSTVNCVASEDQAFYLWNSLSPGMFIVVYDAKLTKNQGEVEIKFCCNVRNPTSIRLLPPSLLSTIPSLSLVPPPLTLSSMSSLTRLPWKSSVNLFGRVDFVSAVLTRRVSTGDFQLYRIMSLTFLDQSVLILLTLSSKPESFFSLSAGLRVIITHLQLRSFTPNSVRNHRSIMFYSTTFTTVITPSSNHPWKKLSVFSNIPLPSDPKSLSLLPMTVPGLSKLFTVLRLVSVKDLYSLCRTMAAREGIFTCCVCKIFHEGHNHIKLMALDGLTSIHCEAAKTRLFGYDHFNSVISKSLMREDYNSLSEALLSVSGDKVVVLCWVENCVERGTFVEVVGVYKYSQGFVYVS